MNNYYIRSVIGGIFGIGIFLWVYLGIAPSGFSINKITISSIIGIIATIGFQVLLPYKRTLEDEIQNISKISNINSQEVANIIHSAQEKISRIEKANIYIKNQKLQKRIKSIITISSQIIDGFIEDPDDIKRSKAFLNQYLEQTSDLVEKYVQLERKNTSFEEINKKFEETLSEIETAFKKQYDRNISDDVFNLDVDMDVLNKMIKQEGF